MKATDRPAEFDREAYLKAVREARRRFQRAMRDRARARRRLKEIQKLRKELFGP